MTPENVGMKFSERVACHRSKALILKTVFGKQAPKCVIPRRPNWWQQLIIFTQPPWSLIHVIDFVFKVWYGIVDAFFDTCVWIQIKRGKLIP